MIKKALHHRVQLTATGFFRCVNNFEQKLKLPHFRSRFIDYENDTHVGHQFTYITYGIAVSEIELDILTGQHKLLEAEILMDVGRSLNPAIDIGQIEGAFTQDLFYDHYSWL